MRHKSVIVRYIVYSDPTNLLNYISLSSLNLLTKTHFFYFCLTWCDLKHEGKYCYKMFSSIRNRNVNEPNKVSIKDKFKIIRL